MRRPSLKMIFVCIGLFFFFLVMRFPFQSLQGYVFGKIQKETGVILVAEDMYLSLFGWPGIGLRNVDATIPMGDTELDISSKKMTVRVGLAGLFPPTPSFSLSASGLKKGGDLYVKFSQGKTFHRASFSLDEVNLDQFGLPNGQKLQGQITMDGDLNMDSEDLTKSQGQIELEVKKFKTPGQNLQGIVLPDVNFGNLKSKITIKNGVVDINSFNIGASGSDISGTIAGEVRLGNVFARSYLNITLKLQLSEPFRNNPNSATIVSLLNSIDNTSPGNYAMKWSTSIEGITTNLWNALPQKAL